MSNFHEILHQSSILDGEQHLFFGFLKNVWDYAILAIIVQYCTILCNNDTLMASIVQSGKIFKNPENRFFPHPKCYPDAKFHGNWTICCIPDVIRRLILGRFSWISPYICLFFGKISKNHAHFEVLYLNNEERFLNSVKSL